MNRYAAALSLHPDAGRGGRRGRGRDPRTVRRRASRPPRVLRVAAPRRRVRGRRGRAAQAARTRGVVGCTAVGVAGGGVEVEDGPGLSVLAASFGAGRVDGVALDARETDDGFDDRRLARLGARARHAADARRPVLVPGRPTSSRCATRRCPTSRSSAGWRRRACGPAATGSCSTTTSTHERRGRAAVLRRRAGAPGRVAGLPADRHAAHGDHAPSATSSTSSRASPRWRACRSSCRPRPTTNAS